MFGRPQNADGATPAQFMAEQLADALLRTAMADRKRHHSDSQTPLTHRTTNFVVVGEIVAECFKAADLLQRRVTQRNRRTEARMCDSPESSEHHTRQEVVAR